MSKKGEIKINGSPRPNLSNPTRNNFNGKVGVSPTEMCGVNKRQMVESNEV